MAADTKTHLYEWSTTESSNLPVGSTVISTNLDDNLRMIQKVVRDLAAPTTLAAAAGSTDLGSKDETFITLTGTAVTITGLGTVSAGIYKWVIFNAAHVLTHNGTSLILPTGANITAAAGDVALFVSLASGNWKCLSYTRASGAPVVTGVSFDTIADSAAAGTILNADYAQALQWALTTAGKIGLEVTESAAATGADAILLQSETIAASTAWPLVVKARTIEVMAVEELGQVSIASAPGTPLQIGKTSGETEVSSASPGAVTIDGQHGTLSNTGGAVTITGGRSPSGTGGAVNIDGGLGAPYGAVNISGSSLTVSAPLRVTQTTAPTITANGGTGASIVGTDSAFQVTFGSGNPTSVTVDFNVAHAAAPMVFATGTQSAQIVHVAAVSTTQVQISSSAAFSSGTKVNVLCIEVA